jgi:exosortase
VIIGVLLIWIGGFLLFFGARSLQKARSAFLYLIFLIPVPSFAMDGMIEFLQQGSAEAANILFKLIGIPFLRDGVTFHFSELSIEITEQCSGIRSSMALIITAVLGGHIFLRTYRRRTFLMLSALPLAVIKNGIRITVLSLLATYVDKSYLANSLIHNTGGIFFLLPSLLILFIILKFLKRSEQKGYEKLASQQG